MITVPQLMRPRVKEITGIKSVHHLRKKLVTSIVLVPK